MVNVEDAFLAVAVIIFIGYYGLLFFKKTKISELVILMLIGLIIGPIMGFLGPGEIQIFQEFLPFFASFALTVILFEGGMHLNFFKTVLSLPSAFVFTTIIFILTIVLIGVTWFVFTGDLLVGILIGAILGGTSSEVIIPLVSQTSAKEETKTLLGLESALTDALCVIVALTMAQIIITLNTGTGNGLSFAQIGSSILGAFSIAAVSGGILGFVWLKLLTFFEKRPYEYLVTLAVLLFLYSINQYFNGNGAIAALVFGMVLGNSEDLTNMLRLQTKKMENTIKSFQAEVTFLVRTFFFVYLGVLFNLNYLKDFTVLGISLIIIAIILATRFAGAKILSKFIPSIEEDILFITTMNGRGLAAASLIAFPAILALNLGETMNKITAIVFIIIFASNIATTIGVFISEKEKKDTAVKKLKEVATKAMN